MTDGDQSLSTPKRSGNSAGGKASWYTYYAGFSPWFVRDVLGVLDLSKNSVICDPWNGAGTTTQVAHDLGYSVFGYDLNPAMVTVAKARLLGPHTEPSHTVLCSHIVRKASQYCAQGNHARGQACDLRFVMQEGSGSRECKSQIASLTPNQSPGLRSSISRPAMTRLPPKSQIQMAALAGIKTVNTPTKNGIANHNRRSPLIMSFPLLDSSP